MFLSSSKPKLRSSLECDQKAYVEEASIESVPEKVAEMSGLGLLTPWKLHTHVITHGHVQATPSEKDSWKIFCPLPLHQNGIKIFSSGCFCYLTCDSYLEACHINYIRINQLRIVTE